MITKVKQNTLHTPGGSVISNAKNTRYRSDKMHNLMECTIHQGQAINTPGGMLFLILKIPSVYFQSAGEGWGGGMGREGGKVVGGDKRGWGNVINLCIGQGK